MIVGSARAVTGLRTATVTGVVRRIAMTASSSKSA